MKCLKVEEYVKRTASLKETELLRQELEVSTETGWRKLQFLLDRNSDHQLSNKPSSIRCVKYFLLHLKLT